MVLSPCLIIKIPLHLHSRGTDTSGVTEGLVPSVRVVEEGEPLQHRLGEREVGHRPRVTRCLSLITEYLLDHSRKVILSLQSLYYYYRLTAEPSKAGDGYLSYGITGGVGVDAKELAAVWIYNIKRFHSSISLRARFSFLSPSSRTRARV